MSIKDVFLKTSDNLHICREPTIKVFPDGWAEWLKVKMLNQVGLQALSLAFRNKLVEKVDVDYARGLFVQLLWDVVIGRIQVRAIDI